MSYHNQKRSNRRSIDIEGLRRGKQIQDIVNAKKNNIPLTEDQKQFLEAAQSLSKTLNRDALAAFKYQKPSTIHFQYMNFSDNFEN